MHDPFIELIHSPKGNHGPEEFFASEYLFDDHFHPTIFDHGDKFIIGHGREDGFPLAMTFPAYGHLRFPDTLQRPRAFQYLWREMYESQTHELIALPSRLVPSLELYVFKPVGVEIHVLLEIGAVD